MDLNRLAMFVRVVEGGSFTRAASALGLRKSSVSRGVTRLEVPELAINYLSEIVAHFVRRYPKIHVELVLTSRSVDLVEERIDIALRAGRLVDSSLIARKIVATDLEIFAAPAYLRRRGKPRALTDLASHECVLYRPEAGKSIWRLTGPHSNESIEVKGSISADDMTFLQRAVLAGAGIGLLPSLDLRKYLERGELVHLLPGYGMTGGALYLVSPASRHQLARVRLLREFLLAHLSKVWEV